MVHRAPPSQVPNRATRPKHPSRGGAPRATPTCLQARGGPDRTGRPDGPPLPPLLPRHMRRGSGSALPHLRVPPSPWWPLSWRRDGRVPRPRPRAPRPRHTGWQVGVRLAARGGLVPSRGPNPATSARLLRRCLVPSAGFYSVSEHSPPRADLDASDSAARRPLLLDRVGGVGCVACTTSPDGQCSI